MSTNSFLQRRHFLGKTACASALVLLGLTADVFAAKKKDRNGKKNRKKRRGKRSRRPKSSCDLCEEHFEDLVGEVFEASSMRHHVKLKLIEVREHDHHTDDDNRPTHIRQESFSLLFLAPGGEILPSRIYELEHPDLGDFDLFLHEVGEDRDVNTIHYEVVFN